MNTLIFTIPILILSYIFPNSFWVVLIMLAYYILLNVLGYFIPSGKLRTILMFQNDFVLKYKKYRHINAIIIGILAIIVSMISDKLSLPENAYLSMILCLILIAQFISGVIYFYRYKNE